jgi:hypothetical protein
MKRNVQTGIDPSDKDKRVIVTNPFVGICHIQVCAVKDATDKEILETCNRENMSGISHGWCSVIRTGKGKPLKCASDPSRLHILVGC